MNAKLLLTIFSLFVVDAAPVERRTLGHLLAKKQAFFAALLGGSNANNNANSNSNSNTNTNRNINININNNNNNNANSNTNNLYNNNANSRASRNFVTTTNLCNGVPCRMAPPPCAGGSCGMPPMRMPPSNGCSSGSCGMPPMRMPPSNGCSGGSCGMPASSGSSGCDPSDPSSCGGSLPQRGYY
ncbi:hypothetical protein DSO57_1014726 [Entomophthora muscae]|uniref:Uncharacterized protein n=1 Tax=Entomophthora muscae TaxID=34485 RepID=A0ACC2U352_9FUNG|nr:hypothetical protein DSO57_1014726 [Entomophthora muscae]